MQSLFGLELTTAQKLIVASVVILVLLGLLLLVARQLKSGRLRVPGQGAGRQRQPRLGIVDSFDLDNQRQLVLIRRDNVEHLLMVGGASDVVVESNIVRAGSRSTTPMFSEPSAQDRPLPPFETLVPPSEPAIRAGEELRRTITGNDVEDVVPAVPMRPVQIPVESAAAAGVATALGVEGFSATRSAPTAPAPAAPSFPAPSFPAPSFAREHAPAPAASADELDDMARQLEAALKRPHSAVRPAHPAEEAPAQPVRSPAPAPVLDSPVVPAPPVASAAKIEPVIPDLPKREPVLAPPAPPAEPKRAAPAPAKPQAMLDMEAELEAALGLKPKPVSPRPGDAAEPIPAKPSTPPKPLPVFPPKPPAAKPFPAVPEPANGAPPADVPEAAMQPAPIRPSEPEIVVPEPLPPPAGPAEPEPAVTLAEAPVAAPAPEVNTPAFDGADAKTVEAKPAEAVSAGETPAEPKPAEPAKELDPFSVDAIEAEFARLLGRDPKVKS